jgi:NAD(P)-dependent dehydrogenase (short-subunit alcohol dehydrogenase family)
MASPKTQPMAERAALVTGASGGIGSSLATTLAADGFDVTLSGRDEGRLKEVAAGLPARPGASSRVQRADLTIEDDIVTLASAHREAFGRLDVLVNCAGGGILAQLDAIKTRHVDMQLALNLRATILLVRACLPLLRTAARAAGRAHVINMSSAAGKRGQPGLPVYSAAKFGLVGFTEACNRDYGPEGIRSTVFCPGLVDTPLAATYDAAPEDMVSPEDLGEAIRFLLRLSDPCLVPELSFLAPNGRVGDE